MQNDTDPSPAEPTVKLWPTYTVGQTVQHIGEGTEHKIIEIIGETARLSGLCGLTPFSGIQPL